MSAASTTDRVKASKLRTLERELSRMGKRLTQKQQAFLERYTRDHPPPKQSTKSSTHIRSPAVRASTSTAPPVDRSRDVDLDFGKPQPPAPAPASAAEPSTPPSSAAASSSPPAPAGGAELAAHDPNASICPVGPGCPGCKSAGGGYVVCATTQRKQWPMMDEDGARGMGGMVLGGLTYAGKVFRADHAVIKFEEDEQAHFAKVLAKFLYRYASWAGQANELTAMMFVGSVMVAKVATADAPPKKQAQPINGAPRASDS